MIRKGGWLVSNLVLVAALGVGPYGNSIAHGGGGRGGDSSMNPFTGDSYAYFNGGHNLGEEGMIRPGRPAPQPQLRGRANNAPDATAKNVPGSVSEPSDTPRASRDDQNRNPPALPR